jgi:hypothetical protein
MNEKPHGESNLNSLIRPKWGIRTMLIWVVIASGLVLYFQNRFRIAAMKTEIISLQQFADELIVDDPQRIAARRKDFSEYDDVTWQLYLPPDYSYTLNLATENLDKSADLSTVNAEVTSALSPGNMELHFTLDYTRETVVVRVTNGSKTLLEVAKSNQLLSGGIHDSISITERSCSNPPEIPLSLISRVYVPPGRQTGPISGRGIFLWIEATKLTGKRDGLVVPVVN